MSEKRWQDELTAYVDGELSEAERRAVEAQLAVDPSLRALEARLRQTVGLMAKVTAPVPSPALKAQVFAGLEPEPGPRGWFSWPKLVPVVALAAAAALVVVLRAKAPEAPAVVEEDQVLLAQHMELVEDLDLLGLGSAEDLDVVEQLKDLEATP